MRANLAQVSAQREQAQQHLAAAETEESRKACLAQLKDFDGQRDELIAALAGLDADTIDDDWDADFDFDEDRALTFADLLDEPDSPADPPPVLACTAQVQPIATTSVTADATPTPTAQVTGPARPSGTSAWFVPQEKAKQRDRFGRLLGKTRTPSGLASAVFCTLYAALCVGTVAGMTSPPVPMSQSTSIEHQSFSGKAFMRSLGMSKHDDLESHNPGRRACHVCEQEKRCCRAT